MQALSEPLLQISACETAVSAPEILNNLFSAEFPGSFNTERNKRRKDGCSCICDLEKMKVHLYSIRDQSCEKQVWFNIKLASGLYTGVSHSLFKHDELSLIIWWMMYFFYDHVLVKPQRSSSLHSFWVCLADLKAFSCLMCDKCVPARRLSWVYACLLIVTIIGFKSSTILFCERFIAPFVCFARLLWQKCLGRGGDFWTAGSWTHIPSELHFKGHRESFSPLWKQMCMASRCLRLFQDQQ